MAQKKALENLWPIYGLERDAPFLPEIVYGRKAPLIVEIGFGNGSNLAEDAERHPENDYLGIEVHEPGIGHLLYLLAKREICNVRIFEGDANEILGGNLKDGSIDRINLFFPDPWPKKRHHKRRLVSRAFADLVLRKLGPGGCFHAATDCEDYAIEMAEILGACKGLDEITGSNSRQAFIAERSETRFERRGRLLGHLVRDLIFLKHE